MGNESFDFRPDQKIAHVWIGGKYNGDDKFELWYASNSAVPDWYEMNKNIRSDSEAAEALQAELSGWDKTKVQFIFTSGCFIPLCKCDIGKDILDFEFLYRIHFSSKPVE